MVKQHSSPLAMDLGMAMWMQQYQVIHRFRASISSPLNLVEIPSGFFGDVLLAQRTDSGLTKPEAKQSFAIFEVVQHVKTGSFFKVDFPVGIVRLAAPVTLTCRLMGILAAFRSWKSEWDSVFSSDFSAQPPALLTELVKVFDFDPNQGLLWVSAFDPSPEGQGNCMVYFLKVQTVETYEPIPNSKTKFIALSLTMKWTVLTIHW